MVQEGEEDFRLVREVNSAALQMAYSSLPRSHKHTHKSAVYLSPYQFLVLVVLSPSSPPVKHSDAAQTSTGIVV